MLYTWTWYQAHRFEFARKTGFQVKQQFVTKTLIPRIFTKHITNDSMEKKKTCTVTQSLALQCTLKLAGHWYFENSNFSKECYSNVFIYII